jgi:hypothetical protein
MDYFNNGFKSIASNNLLTINVSADQIWNLLEQKMTEVIDSRPRRQIQQTNRPFDRRDVVSPIFTMRLRFSFSVSSEEWTPVIAAPSVHASH